MKLWLIKIQVPIYNINFVCSEYKEIKIKKTSIQISEKQNELGLIYSNLIRGFWIRIESELRLVWTEKKKLDRRRSKSARKVTNWRKNLKDFAKKSVPKF